MKSIRASMLQVFTILCCLVYGQVFGNDPVTENNPNLQNSISKEEQLQDKTPLSARKCRKKKKKSSSDIASHVSAAQRGSLQDLQDKTPLSARKCRKKKKSSSVADLLSASTSLLKQAEERTSIFANSLKSFAKCGKCGKKKKS